MPGGGSAASARTRRAARLRGPQRVLEGGAHEIEDVAVALGELTLGAAETGDDHLTTLRADADRDAVLDAGSVEQVAVQLAVGQAAGLDGLGETQRRTPAGGMREQERVTRRVAHDCRERAGRLGLGGDRLVADSAGGELDAIPRQHVCRDELREPLQRPAAQLGHRPGFDERPGEPVRGTHVWVGEPGHRRATDDDTPGGAPGWRKLRSPSLCRRASRSWSRYSCCSASWLRPLGLGLLVEVQPVADLGDQIAHDDDRMPLFVEPRRGSTFRSARRSSPHSSIRRQGSKSSRRAA